MSYSVLLVNTNVSQPLVSPVGLEYVGEALLEAKALVRVLDLAFEVDWATALARELGNSNPLIVGLSVRNTDDCCFATRKTFIPWIKEVVDETRRLTDALVVLGGVGFSVMPEDVLRLTQADAGIAGDGEVAMKALSKCLLRGKGFSDLPNIVYWRTGNIISNPMVYVDLRHLPPSRRNLFDNRRYERQGAVVGVETKRGCAQRCIFCADPLAKGNRIRLRAPSNVVKEFQDLLTQGVSWFHLCDSEFNLPVAHAKEICQAIIQAGLGNRIRWYCYCAPAPFDQELAKLMKRAGCMGINFGVDSLCDEQLFRLGRSHRVYDVEELTHILKEVEINYIFDFLVGGPGETEETIRKTIEEVKRLNVPLAGVAVGVRIYPGTPLGKAIENGSIKEETYPKLGNKSYEPIFFLSPYLGDDVSQLISDFVGSDPRFLFLTSPNEEGSYNYAGDEVLCQMIKQGARGAYWDIIRKSQGG